MDITKNCCDYFSMIININIYSAYTGDLSHLTYVNYMSYKKRKKTNKKTNQVNTEYIFVCTIYVLKTKIDNDVK